MEWYRRYNGTNKDPKFKLIAKKAGQHLCFVLSVWEEMLEYSSSHETRGSLVGFNAELAACALDLDVEVVESIYQQMQTLGLHDGENIAAWDKRQFESDSSAERVRRYRERKAQNSNATKQQDNDTETICNGDVTLQKRDVTPPEQIQNRTEVTTLEMRATDERDSFREVVEVIELEAPHLLTKDLNPIRSWLNAGCDPGLDIVPTIRRKCQEAMQEKREIKSLAFFAGAISDAKARRTKPMPEGSGPSMKPAEIQQSYIIRLQKKTQLDAEESAILAHWENQQKAIGKALIPGTSKPEHKPPEEEYKWLKNLEKKGIPLSKDQKEFLEKHQPEHAA